MSSCKCQLSIHERRRRTKNPVRVPILTHEEHIYLLLTVIPGAIKARQRELRKLNRASKKGFADEKRAFRLGVKLLQSIGRELRRS